MWFFQWPLTVEFDALYDITSAPTVLTRLTQLPGELHLERVESKNLTQVCKFHIAGKFNLIYLGGAETSSPCLTMHAV